MKDINEKVLSAFKKDKETACKDLCEVIDEMVRWEFLNNSIYLVDGDENGFLNKTNVFDFYYVRSNRIVKSSRVPSIVGDAVTENWYYKKDLFDDVKSKMIDKIVLARYQRLNKILNHVQLSSVAIDKEENKNANIFPILYNICDKQINFMITDRLDIKPIHPNTGEFYYGKYTRGYDLFKWPLKLKGTFCFNYGVNILRHDAPSILKIKHYKDYIRLTLNYNSDFFYINDKTGRFFNKIYKINFV